MAEVQNSDAELQHLCTGSSLKLQAVPFTGVAPPLSKWSGQEVGVVGCGLSETCNFCIN